jgi:hypothetical protein
MKFRNESEPASAAVRMLRIPVIALAFCTFLSISAGAISATLQPEEIQEAYSLGQTTNHEELANFIKQYQHEFKYPTDNSIGYVQSVEFETPYEQIVLRSRQTTEYTKFQASEDYRANPGLVIVRAVVSLKLGYAGVQPMIEKFKVEVSQTKSIEPRETDNKIICNPYNWIDTNCMVFTREILLRFDTTQFGPGDATVKIFVPEGQSVETKYNLDELK